MKATKLFKQYRNAVLGLPLEDYRDLQAGKDVKVDDKIVKKFPQLFTKVIKEAKDGNR